VFCCILHVCVCVCVCVVKLYTHAFKIQQNTYLGQLVSVSIMLYFRELPVPVAAVSVFYIPDDGRMTPETCRESVQ
jgi:hypothetical protein